MLFDTTVQKEISRSFWATVVVVLTIVLTTMLIRTLGLAASGSVAPQDVVLMLGYVALGQLPTVLTLSIFVAIVVSLARMYRDSEMAAWFASGVSLTRFIAPVLRTAWPVVIAVALLTLVAWPWGNRQINELRTRYEQRTDLLRVAPGTFQSSSDGTRVFFVERAGDTAGGGRNVFLVTQEKGRESVTTARAGRLVREGGERVLMLDAGHRHEVDTRTGEYTRVAFDSYRMLVDEATVRSAQTLPPKATDTWELLTHPNPRRNGELVGRLGMLFACANLLLLAIGTSATNPRRASSWNLVFALLAYFIYFNLIGVSQGWVSAGRIGVGTAVTVLHGSALLLGLALLWIREHAATSRGIVRAPEGAAA